MTHKLVCFIDFKIVNYLGGSNISFLRLFTFLSGNFKIVENWTTEHTRISGESSPMRKSSDHVTLTSEMSGSGRTLVEIFSSTDEQAVLPYTGSGPVVLYNAKKILTTKISEMVSFYDAFDYTRRK